jgi:hypothetical protein
MLATLRKMVHPVAAPKPAAPPAMYTSLTKDNTFRAVERSFVSGMALQHLFFRVLEASQD